MNFKEVIKRFIEIGERIPGISPFAYLAETIVGKPADGALPVIPPTDRFQKIQQIILDVEAFGQLAGLTGPQKAAVAGPLVDKALRDILRLQGFEVADPVFAAEVAKRIGGDINDYMIAFKKK